VIIRLSDKSAQSVVTNQPKSKPERIAWDKRVTEFILYKNHLF